MTARTGGARETRRVTGPDGTYLATVAWRREASGYGLLYLIALDGDEPRSDDGGDRRVLLEPGSDPAEWSDGDLRRRAEEASPLTGTERRFRAPDGRLWLAQSVGPVWADEDPAEGSTGVVFTALEGRFERLRGPGVHVGEASAGELAEWWRRAGSGGDDGDGAGSGGGPGPEGDAADGGA